MALIKANQFSHKLLSPKKRSSYGTAYDHSVRVATTIIYDFGIREPKLIIAALLHDIIEDTDTTFKEIQELFSLEIAEIIKSVSRTKISVPKHLEIDKTLTRIYENLTLLSKTESSKILKCADRIDNLRDMLDIPETDGKFSRIPYWATETRLSMLPVAKNLPSQIQITLLKELENVEKGFPEECTILLNFYSFRLKETVNSIDETAVYICPASFKFADIIG